MRSRAESHEPGTRRRDIRGYAETTERAGAARQSRCSRTDSGRQTSGAHRERRHDADTASRDHLEGLRGASRAEGTRVLQRDFRQRQSEELCLAM